MDVKGVSVQVMYFLKMKIFSTLQVLQAASNHHTMAELQDKHSIHKDVLTALTHSYSAKFATNHFRKHWKDRMADAGFITNFSKVFFERSFLFKYRNCFIIMEDACPQGCDICSKIPQNVKKPFIFLFIL